MVVPHLTWKKQNKKKVPRKKSQHLRATNLHLPYLLLFPYFSLPNRKGEGKQAQPCVSPFLSAIDLFHQCVIPWWQIFNILPQYWFAYCVWEENWGQVFHSRGQPCICPLQYSLQNTCTISKIHLKLLKQADCKQNKPEMALVWARIDFCSGPDPTGTRHLYLETTTIRTVTVSINFILTHLVALLN